MAEFNDLPLLTSLLEGDQLLVVRDGEPQAIERDSLKTGGPREPEIFKTYHLRALPGFPKSIAIDPPTAGNSLIYIASGATGAARPVTPPGFELLYERQGSTDGDWNQFQTVMAAIRVADGTETSISANNGGGGSDAFNVTVFETEAISAFAVRPMRPSQPTSTTFNFLPIRTALTDALHILMMEHDFTATFAFAPKDGLTTLNVFSSVGGENHTAIVGKLENNFSGSVSGTASDTIQYPVVALLSFSTIN